MFPRSALLLTSLLCLGSPALGQWDTIKHDPSNPVFDEGFLLAHDDGTDLLVYSALTREFRPLAGTGAIVHGTGDWTVLFEDTTGFVAYSARLDETTPMPMPANFNVTDVVVEDDVAMVLGQVPGGFQAIAYSAQTGTWANQPMVTAADIVSSRFVIGIREGVDLHGFAARTGAWDIVFGGNIDPATAVADGNVATYERVAAGDRRLLAFSGVLGVWTLSPILFPGTVIETDHNVAMGFERLGGGLIAPTSYSAYTGAFVTAGGANAPAEINQVLIDDNVVLVERFVAPRFSAIGARPQVWDANNLPNATIQAVRESLVLVANAQTLLSYSGLCDGTWQAQAYAGPPVHVTSGEKHVVVQDLNDEMHAFSPANAAWAAPYALAGPSFHEGDSITVLTSGVERVGYSTRSNAWTPGPLKPALVAHSENVGGSGHASQIVGTVGAKTIEFYNGRTDLWNGAYSTALVTPTWHAERTVLVADATAGGGALYGYSVQRDNFVESTASVATPLVVGVQVEENVAWAVDANDELHCFSPTLDTHAWFAWPEGSEFQAPATPAGPISQRITIQGAAGNLTWLMYGLAPDHAGLVLPGVGGSLHLQLPLLFSLFLGVIPPDGKLESGLPIPATAPVALDLWNQAVMVDAAFNVDFTGPAPEASFLF